MYTGWTNAQALELHAPPISNAGTDLQRTYPTLPCGQRRTRRHPGAGVGLMYAGWTNAQALELPPRRWPTPVPISNVRTQLTPAGQRGARLPLALSYAVIPQAHQVEVKQPPPAFHAAGT